MVLENESDGFEEYISDESEEHKSNENIKMVDNVIINYNL